MIWIMECLFCHCKIVPSDTCAWARDYFYCTATAGMDEDHSTGIESMIAMCWRCARSEEHGVLHGLLGTPPWLDERTLHSYIGLRQQ